MGWYPDSLAAAATVQGNFRKRFKHFLLPLLATAGLALPPVAQASAVPTVTTLVLSSSSVVWPAAVTLTATVTPAAVGTVTFCNATATDCEDSAVVGSAQLVAGTATLKIVAGIGQHTYKAIFSATTAAAGSSSSAQMLTVSGPLYPTTTTMAASGNPSGYRLTTTVTGEAGNPPLLAGNVSFVDTSDSNHVVGTTVLGEPVFTQSFSAAAGSPISTGNNPAATGVGDFDGDGKPDLAVVDSGENAVTILHGNGDGTFTTAATIFGVGTVPCASGQANCAIAVGDFNDDGHLDLAVTSSGDNTLTILLGNGDDTFTAADGSPITVGSLPEAVKIGDFNRDGQLDLAVANGNDDTVSILLGNGDGTFRSATGSPIAVGALPFFLAVADFNGDGNPDLAVVNGNANTVSILLGDGDGAFAPLGSPIAVGAGPSGIVAADFNHDGNVDLAVADFDANTVDILLGNGDGTFVAASAAIPVGSQPFAMAGGDFNDDGNADLAVVNYGDQTLTVLLGDGAGGFLPPGPAVSLGNSPNDVVSADLNGDGAADLAIAELGDNNLTILLNQILQTATAAVTNATVAGAGSHQVVATYSGNSFFAGSTSATVALNGSAVSTALALAASPATQLVTMPITFTTQLTSTSSYPPIGTPTGMVSFSDGGVVLGTAPINAVGQATYTTTSLVVGVHSITAAYAGDANFLPSSSSTSLSVTVSDLKITLSSGNTRTITPGAAASYTFQIAPVGGTTFLYDVAMTVSGLPPGATYTLSPTSMPAGGQAGSATLDVQSAAANLSPPFSPYPRLPLALGLLLPLIGARPLRRGARRAPRRLRVLLLAALGVSGLASLSGCSDGGLLAQQKSTYTIAVTATSGTLQRSASVPLAIQ